MQRNMKLFKTAISKTFKLKKTGGIVKCNKLGNTENINSFLKIWCNLEMKLKLETVF